MDPETVELGATLGALESLLGGCTTQLDMYFHHEATHRGAVAAGQPARHRPGLLRRPRPRRPRLGPSASPTCAPGRRLLDEIGGPAVPVAAMPHATYTCSPEGLAEVVSRAAQGPRRGRPPRHAHDARRRRTAAENAGIRERYDATPTELLARTGWVEPDLPLVVGHGVHLTRARPRAARGRGSRGRPLPRVEPQARERRPCTGRTVRDSGIRLGVGTDGCSSSNDLDMWQAMRQAALLARLTSGRPDVASATEVLRAATIEGARALGLGDEIGSVEVGKRADLVLVDLAAPHLTPVHDVAALLVFAAGRGDVTDVLVDGRGRGARPAQHPPRHRRPARPGPAPAARSPGPRWRPCDHAETAEQVIARLRMRPIPEEGAWFVAGPRTQGLNAITVLLTDRPDGFSAMHRLTIDEGWQWLAGAPAALLRLRPGGSGVLNYVDPRPASSSSAAAPGWAPRPWATGPCSPAGARRRSGPSTSSSATATPSRPHYPRYAAEITALTRDEPVGRMR